MISKLLCHVINIEMRLIQRGLTDDERVFLGTAGPMKPARSMTQIFGKGTPGLLT
jgi:hypothetical protein